MLPPGIQKWRLKGKDDVSAGPGFPASREHDPSSEGFTEFSEKLRILVMEKEWPEGVKLTASFGVAQKNNTEAVTNFIERADKALYAAKAQGRNRVITAKFTDTP